MTYCCFYQLLLRNLQLVRPINLTLSLWIKFKKATSEWGIHFWEWGKSGVTKKLITRMNKKNSIHWERKMTSHTHFSWNCMNEWTKSRSEVAVTSYGRNKNLDGKTNRRPIIAPATAVRLLNKTTNNGQSNCSQDLKWNQLRRTFNWLSAVNFHKLSYQLQNWICAI